MILVLMVFAVLMILSTFTLSFMLTENKQAINHQYRTQAYYIARSGAETVEAAILGMDEEEIEELDKGLDNGDILKIDLNNLEFNIEEMPTVEIMMDNGNLLIESIGKIGTIEEKVKMIMTRAVKQGEDELKIKGPPIIALSELLKPNDSNSKKSEWYINYNKEKILVATIDNKTQYNEYQFPSDINWNGGGNYKALKSPIQSYIELGEEDKVTNYVVNGKLEIKGFADIGIKGIVNIFIKNGLDINIKHKDINTSLENNINNLNFYVEKGNIDIFLHQGSITSNIVSSSSGTISIGTQENSNKSGFIGSIYAPSSTINIGHDKAAMLYKGVILGNKITLKTNNDNKDEKFLKNLAKENMDKDGNNDEIIIPIENGKYVIKYDEGYYK